MKKLIPALAMLIVSALVMSSASFAWFTMNRTVETNNMNVTVVAPDNLMISADGSIWNTSAKVDLVAKFPGTSLTTIAPASSDDGLNFAAYIIRRQQG